jgi:hypothetical protein
LQAQVPAPVRLNFQVQVLLLVQALLQVQEPVQLLP